MSVLIYRDLDESNFSVNQQVKVLKKDIKMQNKKFIILNILFYFAVFFLSLNVESLRGTCIVFNLQRSG